MKANVLPFSRYRSQKEFCAHEFFNIAKQDLIAAKVLYRKGLYPEALFFFQQSIEKAYKSYHLFSELGDNHTDSSTTSLPIMKIGHTPTKILERRALDMESRLKDIKRTIDSIPNHHEIYEKIGVDYAELIQQFSELRQVSSQISANRNSQRQMRLHELNDLIVDLSKIMKQSDRLNRDIKRISFDSASREQMKRKNLEMLSPFFKHFPEQAEKFTNENDLLFGNDFEKFEPIFKILIQNRANAGCINVIYSQLSIITQSHESSTRYSSITQSPIREYSRNHPVIRRFNTLVRYAEIANKKFDQIISLSEDLQ